MNLIKEIITCRTFTAVPPMKRRKDGKLILLYFLELPKPESSEKIFTVRSVVKFRVEVIK